MANDNNTTGFTGCPSHLEVWRRNAAKQAADDRYTVVFDVLVDAFGEFTGHQTEFRHGVYAGLRQAFAYLTGDTIDVVHEQVASAFKARLRETVAAEQVVPVPS